MKARPSLELLNNISDSFSSNTEQAAIDAYNELLENNEETSFLSVLTEFDGHFFTINDGLTHLLLQ